MKVHCVNEDCPEAGIAKDCPPEWLADIRCGFCDMPAEEVPEDAA